MNNPDRYKPTAPVEIVKVENIVSKTPEDTQNKVRSTSSIK